MDIQLSMVWILGLAVAVIVGVLAFNRVHSRWLYRPSRLHVADLLSRALLGKVGDGELDYFISVPIKRDSFLEGIREEFSGLYGPSAFDSTQSPTGVATWTQAARERVEAMVESLREEPPNNPLQPTAGSGG